MKALMISPTVLVNLSSIEAVEEGETGTIVHVSGRQFQTLIPISTFIELMNKDSGMESDIRQLRQTSQFFGG